MAHRPSPSTRSICSRHVALLVLATLFFWLSSYILPCSARVVRTYTLLKGVTSATLSLTMPEMQAACKSQVNGMMPVADSAEKHNEIVNFAKANMPPNADGSGPYPILGGMMVSNRPDGWPPQSITEARWCWVYGDGLCGPSNEALIGTHDGNKFITAPGRYSRWHDGYPVFDIRYPFMTIGLPINDWYSLSVYLSAALICVVEKWIPDPAPPTTLAPTPVGSLKDSLWRNILVVLAVALVVAIVIACVVFFCCWGGCAPTEEESSSGADDRLPSDQDTPSNVATASGGSSSRSADSPESTCSKSESDDNDDEFFARQPSDTYIHY